MKSCPRCGLRKSLDEFVRNRTARNGIGSYCRPCHNEMGRLNRAKNWEGSRFYHLRRRYGINREHFERLFHSQRGLCAICREEPAVHVDHEDAFKLALAIGHLQRSTAAPEGHS